MTDALSGRAGAGSGPVAVLVRPTPESLALAAAAAGAVLTGASRGSAVVAALLLGAAVADRRAAAAGVLAVLATSLRFRTASLDGLAGIQEVLGIAGNVGPATGAGASWLAATAVLLATGPLAGRPTVRLRLAPAVPAGLLAAALVAGPGPSDLVVRMAASALAVALAAAVVRLAERAGDPDPLQGPDAGDLDDGDEPWAGWGIVVGSGRPHRSALPATAVSARPWLAVTAAAAAVVLAAWPS